MDFLDDILARLSPGHILEDPSRVENPAYVYVGGILAILGLLGLILAQRPHLLARGNTLHQRIIETYCGWLVWICGFGILAVIVRYANAPFFSKRLWIVADLLALLGLGGHFAWYRWRRYRIDLEAYAEAQRRQRFRPVVQARQRRSPSRRR